MKVMILITSFPFRVEIEPLVCLDVCLFSDYECDSDNDRNSSAQNVPSLCIINQKSCCNMSYI